MKLSLYQVFVVAALLAAACEARRGRHNWKGYEKIVVEKPDADKDLEVILKGDDTLDIDEETENVLDAMSGGMRGRMGGRRGGKIGRGHGKDMERSRRCGDLEDKVTGICEKINPAIENGRLDQLTQKSKKIAGWVKCCGLETYEERLECFTEMQKSKFEAICNCSRIPTKFSECCQVEDEERATCFNDLKQRRCSNDSSSEHEHTHFGRNHTKCDYNTTKWQDEDQDSTRVGDFKNMKDKIKGRRGKMCYKAGRDSIERLNETASCDVCILNLDVWADEQESMTEMCAHKFMWGCMNSGADEGLDRPFGNWHRTFSTNSTHVPSILRGKIFRPSIGGRMRSQDGEGRNFGGRMRNQDGQGRNFGGRMRNQDGEGRNFGGRMRNQDGESRNFGGRMRNQDGEGRNFGGRMRNQDGEGRNFGGRMRNQDGEGRNFGGRMRNQDGEGRNFGGRMRNQDGQERNFDRLRQFKQQRMMN